MKKKNLLTALFAILFTVANADSNFGIDYFGVGELQTAKSYFEKNVSQSPAESNYYLGEIAFTEGRTDDAKAFYEKGIVADPLYMLNYIGKGKVLLKTDQKAAETIFATTLKKNKKNPALNVAVARAYYECGMKDIALAKLEIAKKYAKKSPLVYVLEGDMLKDEKKFGEAAGRYEQAKYFDPNFTIAYIKCAQVYVSINPTLSIEILNKVIAAHPDYKIAYRDLAKSYAQNGFYQNAIDAFKNYFAEGSYSIEDITTFASAYYFTEQYSESLKLVNTGLAIDSTNFVLNRFRMYNSAKLKDKVNGVAYAEYFFTLKSENGAFIQLDYMAYASLLADAGQFEKSLELFNKILAEDSSKPEIYKELFSVYNKMADNKKAAETYKKYMDLMGADYVGVLDYYQLGRSYYSAGMAMAKDSTESGIAQRKEYLTKADSAFAVVCNLTPDSYTGYLWRGHANAGLDPETSQGLAKPYYEAAVNAILAKGDGVAANGNKRDLIISYTYLGYFYYLKADKVNSSKYWNLIIELDPNNATAKSVLNEYKTSKK